MANENNNNVKFYHWAITTVVVLLGFALGYIVQSERLKTTVITNTVEIRIIKEQFARIDTKLQSIALDIKGNQ